MTAYFREVYHLAVSVLHLIGLATIFRAIVWLQRHKQENLEHRVLNSFRNRNWHWQSAYSVVARMRRDAAYESARALFQPQVNNWRSLISWLGTLPIRFAYSCRKTFGIPSTAKADRILCDLFRRGLLICAPENPALYRLCTGRGD